MGKTKKKVVTLYFSVHHPVPCFSDYKEGADSVHPAIVDFLMKLMAEHKDESGFNATQLGEYLSKKFVTANYKRRHQDENTVTSRKRKHVDEEEEDDPPGDK